ncbi:MAG: ABC transporter permease [Tissierellia bacterium]|nr:ABC transporter permease [Tissierellia bacterium]
MAKYLVKRLLYMVLVFFVMSFVLFWLYNLIPGDPVASQLAPLKDQLTPEEYQARYDAMRSRLGLDDPLPIRYKKWISNVLKLDFGESSLHRRDVKEVMKHPLKLTITMNIFVVLICLAITIPLGINCAIKRGSTFDKITQVLTVVGYSVPIFIISLFFIFIFAVKLGWFPVSGLRTPNFQGEGFSKTLDMYWHLTLPLAIIIFSSLGSMTRYVRAAMIDALGMDCIKTARAKGVKEKVVIYSHAWRNALLPVVTLIIGWLMSLFSGSLVIEQTFSLPGMGWTYIRALTNLDYNLALAVQMMYIIIALLTNVLSDIAYGIVDPRVRVSK